ncbi:methylated-DNA--[protein]-cysteine S-methyltransferase [Microbacterium sp.]|uniref:methylated-DNA--[protein]-cysteine S-methyltransferase n=1 Tax=Microbacterium sp. TaxID=51671 RepID=UPI0039E257C0
MIRTAFRIHPTPLGDALIVVGDEGLVVLHVQDGPDDDALHELAEALGAFPDPDAEATASVATQLDEYFAGSRRAFELDLDLRLVRGFTRAALRAVCEIPYGETASYGEVAVAAGSPRAHRAVGSACARTPISIVVPAHRVVRTDGSIGEYGGRPEHKRFLLGLEAGGISTSARE